MFENVLVISTFFMGLVAAAMSLCLLFYFLQYPRPLGRALVFMLAGEFVATTMTCLFSWSQMTGGLPLTSPTMASAIRMFAFTVVTLSSLHLAFQIRKIIQD
jgi:hypothetical protein